MIFPRHGDSLRDGNTLNRELEPAPTHTIDVHDESLRDGEQTVGVSFSTEEKVQIAQGLLDAGVRYMSLGYPAVSEHEQECVKTLAALGDPKGFFCLARAKEKDIQAVVNCGVPNVAMFIAISEIHLEHKMRMTEDMAFSAMVDAIKLAKSRGLTIRMALEDCSRTPLERVRRFCAGALEAGANILTIADTNGVLTPLSTQALIRTLVADCGGEKISIHFHNDMGMATANALVAATSGAWLIQGTLLGIGERAGNTRLEELVVGLHAKYGVDVGVSLEKIVALARQMATRVGWPVAPNLPLLGDNVFAHESGIHVHGLMRDARTYEPFPPELVGTEHSVRFGKHSGSASIAYAAKLLGIESSTDDHLRVLGHLKELGRPSTLEHVGNLLRQA